MKRLAFALALVLAFSSASLALNYQNVGVTISGMQTWNDGVVTTNHQFDNTLRINGSGDNWTANAEFVFSTGVKTPDPVQPAFTMNDLYYKATGQPFQFEFWNWGEDAQNADFVQGPIGFIRNNDAPASNNWMARITSGIGGNTSVLNVRNDDVTPDWSLYTKGAVGANTYGLAYRTQFNDRNIIDAWVTTKVNGTELSGEIAQVNRPDAGGAIESKLAFGAKAVLPSNITLLGYVSPIHVYDRKDANPIAVFDGATDKNYFEALFYNLYRGTYSSEKNGTLNTLDIRGRSGDTTPPIGDIFVADNDLFDISVVGDNDWIKNTGWALGLTHTNDTAAGKTSMKLHATYAFEPTKKVAYVRMINADTASDQTSTAVRGFWAVNDKLSISPRLFINAYQPAGTAEEVYNKDAMVVGSYVNYKMSQGWLAGGIFSVNDASGINGVAANTSDLQLQLGYELAF